MVVVSSRSTTEPNCVPVMEPDAPRPENSCVTKTGQIFQIALGPTKEVLLLDGCRAVLACGSDHHLPTTAHSGTLWAVLALGSDEHLPTTAHSGTLWAVLAGGSDQHLPTTAHSGTLWAVLARGSDQHLTVLRGGKILAMRGDARKNCMGVRCHSPLT
jgi:hypothetical protein